ncbi:MAG: hypothetical protein K8R59_18725 [Thermoanaerobaculales bacterium]|nr:hypothetical protein [Thermoanaerobaculales bacterium]
MATPTPRFTFSRYLLRRLLPCVLIVLAGAVVMGFARVFVLFIPGIMGMIAGGVLGWATGRVGRGDPEEVWTFGHRMGLALGAGLLYGVGTAVVVSVVNTGTMGLPLDWLADVVAGTEGEYFVGASKNSFQSVEGELSGAWWLIFSIVDGLLFSFLFLVTTGIGWSPDDGSEDDSVEEDIGGFESVPPPLPLAPGRAAPHFGLISFGFFVVVSLGALVGPAVWPFLGLSPGAEISGERLISELQGDWIFGEEATFLGRTEAERSFTLQRGLRTELVGFSAVSANFMLTVEPRRDGVFEGRLNLRGRDLLYLRMRPSDDRSELAFSVDWYTMRGRTEKLLTARRVEVEP